MKTIRDISDLKDKKVLLRVDFDVALEGAEHEAKIAEPFRIEKQKAMLDYLVERGAKVVMVAHLGNKGEFAPLIPQLHLMLGREISFLKKIEDIQSHLNNYAAPALLENIRLYPGEKENSDELAQQLARGFDLYINNAFAVCHRAHASVSAITKFLPSYAGFLVEDELARLSQAVDAPAEGKIIIIGGAKAATKVAVLRNLINKAEKILIGGIVANDIAKARGEVIGNSFADADFTELLARLDIQDEKLVLPEDYVISDEQRLDIGPKTVETFKSYISKAKMIIWNGPLGVFEKDEFAAGTRAVLEAVVDSTAMKILGGGDTIAILNKFGISEEKFDFISTGGGAMLTVLSGEMLPALVALGYYEK